MRYKAVLKNGMVYVKCMVSMATLYMILEKRGRPINPILSRVQPIQSYLVDNFVSHLGCPNEKFGTHEKISWSCKVT